jgi:hypothetical protein
MQVATEAVKRLAKMFIDVQTAVQDNLTQQDAEKIAEILNNCTEQLENIVRRIKEKEPV